MTKQSVLNTLGKMEDRQKYGVEHKSEEEFINMTEQERSSYIQTQLQLEQLKAIKGMNTSTNKPSLMVYIIIALFLGGLGIHHFYAGNKGRGIIYLLLCWTGLPVILSIFDIIGAVLSKDKFK